MSWIATLRRTRERAKADGHYAEVMHLIEGRTCDDNVERVETAWLHAWLGIPKPLRARLSKRVADVMRRNGWTDTHLWVSGKSRRVYVRDANGGAVPKIRKPGRPVGSKDAAPRARRWKKRPEGVPVDDWRRVRRERGDH